MHNTCSSKFTVSLGKDNVDNGGPRTNIRAYFSSGQMVFRQEDRAQKAAWPNTLDAANDNGGNRHPLAYAAAISFRFPGGESEQTSEQADERRSAPGVSKKCGEKCGDGEERNRLQSISLILLSSVHTRTGSNNITERLSVTFTSNGKRQTAGMTTWPGHVVKKLHFFPPFSTFAVWTLPFQRFMLLCVLTIVCFKAKLRYFFFLRKKIVSYWL